MSSIVKFKLNQQIIIKVLANLLVMFAWVLSTSVLAQDDNVPELDFVGGYYEKGEYKCYAEPCFTIHRGTEAAAAKNRPYVARDWVARTKSCQKAFTQALADASRVEISYAKQGDCVFVVKGEWVDPYDNTVITKIRDIALDQLISYREAHRYGAAYWSRIQRMKLVNDAENLLPVSKAQKKARAGRPPSEWMPEDKTFWCDYIVRREIIQRKYKFFLPREEREFQAEIKQLYCKY